MAINLLEIHQRWLQREEERIQQEQQNQPEIILVDEDEDWELDEEIGRAIEEAEADESKRISE